MGKIFGVSCSWILLGSLELLSGCHPVTCSILTSPPSVIRLTSLKLCTKINILFKLYLFFSCQEFDLGNLTWTNLTYLVSFCLSLASDILKDIFKLFSWYGLEYRCFGIQNLFLLCPWPPNGHLLRVQCKRIQKDLELERVRKTEFGCSRVNISDYYTISVSFLSQQLPLLAASSTHTGLDCVLVPKNASIQSAHGGMVIQLYSLVMLYFTAFRALQ